MFVPSLVRACMVDFDFQTILGNILVDLRGGFVVFFIFSILLYTCIEKKLGCVA